MTGFWFDYLLVNLSLNHTGHEDAIFNTVYTINGLIECAKVSIFQAISVACGDNNPHISIFIYTTSYSKVEGLDPGSPEMSSFTFLLISAPDHAYYEETHDVLLSVEGFSGLSIDRNQFPPVKITLREQILVLVRRADTERLGASTIESGS